MAQIVTITNPLTGQPAQVDQLDHTAQQIDDGLNIARGVSNPNLLDNWYFGNPVNQRGKTEYTEEGYAVDRIYFHYVEGSALSVTSNGLTLRNPNGAWFGEKVPNELFSGRIITFSALIDGNLASFSFVAGSSIIIKPSGLTYYPNFGGKSIDLFYYQPAATSTMEAWKIELGDQQTLAHQDENGKWVLNEIPNYGEQLRRCQRYFYRFPQIGDSYTGFGIGLVQSATKFYSIIKFPVSMRNAPSLVASGSFRLLSADFNTVIPVTSIDYNTGTKASTSDSIEIMATVSGGLTVGTPMYLQTNNDPSAHINFIADL